MSKSDGDDASKYLRKASDSMRAGFSGIFAAMGYWMKWFWVLTEDHQIVRAVVVSAVSTFAVGAFLETAGHIISFFYGRTVPIGDDIMLETLPVPVGLSIYGLLILWLITTLYAYVNIAQLREKIEDLESV